MLFSRFSFKNISLKTIKKWIPFQVLGQFIGLLERVVMSICIIFNQFASIGLVFTAKLIARYNKIKISESLTFAEYYLIGSLFSIFSVLLAA